MSRAIRITVRLLGIAGFAGGCLWVYSAPGFEPALTLIAATAAFLGSFMESHAATTPPQTVETQPALLPETRLLLAEIDDCSKSKTKGITLMMMDSVLGDYRPYLWNNHLHGAAHCDLRDITDIISRVDELVALGYLEHHDSTGALRQYRRTRRQPS
jgi:hypothetical protein